MNSLTLCDSLTMHEASSLEDVIQIAQVYSVLKIKKRPNQLDYEKTLEGTTQQSVHLANPIPKL